MRAAESLESPVWEAAYVPAQLFAGRNEGPGIAASPAAEKTVVTPEASVAREIAPQPERHTANSPRSSEPPGAGAVELPRPPRVFDCRALAAAVRRRRPEGGRIALVSIGADHSTTGDWSAEFADDLLESGAIVVERFAAGGLEHEGSGHMQFGSYRLFFVGSEFAASRGSLLRGVDEVLLVVHEGSTSLKSAEVVRGALAAQGVTFAGFVFVAR
jgi:hypothetical protein